VQLLTHLEINRVFFIWLEFLESLLGACFEHEKLSCLVFDEVAGSSVHFFVRFRLPKADVAALCLLLLVCLFHLVVDLGLLLESALQVKDAIIKSNTEVEVEVLFDFKFDNFLDVVGLLD
jgi:hypothetical protein